MAATLEGNAVDMLVELGRPAEALERADRLLAGAEASGDLFTVSDVRAVAFAVKVARGERVASAEAEALVQVARASAVADLIADALAVAAGLLAAGAPARARDLLAELEQSAAVHTSIYYARRLPASVRTALQIGDRTLATQLTQRLQPRYPLHEYALSSVHAQLFEHGGSYDNAASLYAEAADRWREFGNVPERAHALLGHGRCLATLGGLGANDALSKSRRLFASLGYQPDLKQVEYVLTQLAAAQQRD
jgi:hypothetical protein